MTVTIDVPIVQKRQLYEDIVEITCQIDGNEFPFESGQHVNIALPSLSFPDPKGKNRTFNILSSPNNSQYISFAFVNSDSGFKKTINKLAINSKIQLKGPFGVFTLPANNKELVFICEGIGVVPCISMILYLTEEAAPNKITLIHSGKKKIPYNDTINNLKDVNANIIIHTKLGSIDSNFIKKSISNFSDQFFYVSGPSKTVSAIKSILLQQNVAINNIKTEEFTGY